MQLMGVYACVCVPVAFLSTLISSQLLQQQACRLISGPSHLPAVVREGNITLGGLFSLHDAMMEARLSFNSQPESPQCTGSVTHLSIQKHVMPGCLLFVFIFMYIYVFYMQMLSKMYNFFLCCSMQKALYFSTVSYDET